MSKKISDDDLVEIAGGIDGPFIELDRANQQDPNPTPPSDADRGEVGGVGNTGFDTDGDGNGLEHL